jgi:hypothetical protein
MTVFDVAIDANAALIVVAAIVLVAAIGLLWRRERR